MLYFSPLEDCLVNALIFELLHFNNYKLLHIVLSSQLCLLLRDLQCGMLHCTHLNERLEFGMESVAILSHSYINSRGSIIPCRTAIVDLGLNEVDPGLAPDGAKCGDGKVCTIYLLLQITQVRVGGETNIAL